MPHIGLEFHHVGVACERIDDETEFWVGLDEGRDGRKPDHLVPRRGGMRSSIEEQGHSVAECGLA